MSDTETSQINIHTTAACMTLPKFYEQDPEFWFSICESAFQVAQLTSENTKYSISIRALGPEQWKYATPAVRNRTSITPYTDLKDAVIAEVTMSRLEAQFRPLLERQELDAQKPSEFLNRLRQMCERKLSDEKLRPIWMAKLPGFVQATVKPHTDVDLDKAASLADSVLEATEKEIYPSSVSVAGTEKSEFEEAIINKLEEVCGEIKALKKKV